MTRATDSLEKALGHVFKNDDLLIEALTHPSLTGQPNYQRLEFLGDRVLGLEIAARLHQVFPGEDEGQINRRFSALVRAETLTDMALDLGLDDYIRVEKSAALTGMARNPNVLADVVEAVIAALYLDGGMEPAASLIGRLWGPILDRDSRPAKDGKSALQEWAQGRGLPLPQYRTVGRDGPDHAPCFVVVVTVNEDSAEGRATTKKQAGQQAADNLLARLSAEEGAGQ